MIYASSDFSFHCINCEAVSSLRDTELKSSVFLRDFACYELEMFPLFLQLQYLIFIQALENCSFSCMSSLMTRKQPQSSALFQHKRQINYDLRKILYPLADVHHGFDKVHDELIF